ncbi:MAG TPA: Fe-S-containing hydro-lyase [Peptococcaceae bacterium]|nr:MAG: Fumarate hydratase, class I [Clostridia bacterium 41_269]HBT19988.1 Fe-S-containing hydro-lyase [Peptococcaceae bacterium]
MNGVKRLSAPLNEKQLLNLRAGDEVSIYGVIYTARDAAHKRIYEIIKNGDKMPFDPEGQIIYYVGPTPPRPGRVIGSAGPTTSCRMDKYTPLLLEKGIKAVIGKGKRSEEIKKSFIENGAVYLVALGGAGALLSRHIVRAEVIAFEDLGPEAIYKMEVEGFPAFVCYDLYGRDLFEEGIKKYRKE